MTLRSFLYFLARLLGDITAIRRGPKAVLKRQVRKALMKTAGTAVNSLVRPEHRRRRRRNSQR